MKKMLLLSISACIINITGMQAQTVNGNINYTPYDPFSIPHGVYTKWVGYNTVGGSLLAEDANTVYLGGSPGTTSWNMMRIEGNGPGTQTTGLNIIMFDRTTSGTGQGAAFNVQNNGSNIGLNSFAANGTNATAGLFASRGASNSNIGIDASAEADEGTIQNYGVKAYGNANGNSSVYNYGIHASISASGARTPGTLGSSYAGYFWDNASPLGSATGAAFFNGTTYWTTTTYISDKKFKKDVNNVNEAIDKIMLLKPSTYTYYSNDQFPTFSFPSGNQYGFIAQELEEVIPELVIEGTNPAQFDNNGKKIGDEVKFKSVEYVQLIPVLTAGIQEQQAIIESQNARIEKLEEQVQKLLASTTSVSTATDIVSGAELYQNIPNPFKGYTTIGYRLPDNTTNARIVVLDMTGKQIKSVQLDCCDNTAGEVNIEAYDLSSGMYLYSLMVNGAEVVTKRMVIK